MYGSDFVVVFFVASPLISRVEPRLPTLIQSNPLLKKQEKVNFEKSWFDVDGTISGL